MGNNELLKKAKEIRRDCLVQVSSAKSSHIGSMLSIVDILTYLFNDSKNE